jgi:hypothetical protein
MDPKKQPKKPEENLDPISGEPGAHPVGVGAGTAVGGAAAGAALGAVASTAAVGATLGSAAGPIGTVIGVVAGGVAGAFAGKAVAEKISPTEEDNYWRGNYQARPYVKKGAAYEDYQPAYRYGWESRVQHDGRNFDDVEPQLRTGWGDTKSQLEWDHARHAVRDAWERIEKRSSSVGPGNSRIVDDRED